MLGISAPTLSDNVTHTARLVQAQLVLAQNRWKRLIACVGCHHKQLILTW